MLRRLRTTIAVGIVLCIGLTGIFLASCSKESKNPVAPTLPITDETVMPDLTGKEPLAVETESAHWSCGWFTQEFTTQTVTVIYVGNSATMKKIIIEGTGGDGRTGRQTITTNTREYRSTWWWKINKDIKVTVTLSNGKTRVGTIKPVSGHAHDKRAYMVFYESGGSYQTHVICPNTVLSF